MRLVPATPAEASLRDRLSYAAWEPDLGEDGFAAREGRLRSGLWPRSAITSWLWRDDERVLASCETYEVRSTWRGVPGTSWEIAGVFTEPALRGRGHASAMLRAVVDRAAGRPDAQAIVLFSDVAPAIYERLGFAVRPAFDRVVERAGPSDAVLFGEIELTRVHRDRPLDGFAIWPSLEQIDWHLDRARTKAEVTGRGGASRCGARHGDEYAVWIDDGDELLVVLVTGAHEALIGAAVAYARSIGKRAVRAWETPGWPDALGRREARRSAVPMIRPLAAGLEPAAWTSVPRALWV